MLKARIFNCLSDYTYYQQGQSVDLTYCSIMAYKWDTKDGKLWYKDGLSNDVQELYAIYVHIGVDTIDIVKD